MQRGGEVAEHAAVAVLGAQNGHGVLGPAANANAEIAGEAPERRAGFHGAEIFRSGQRSGDGLPPVVRRGQAVGFHQCSGYCHH